MASIADIVQIASQFGIFEYYLPFLILFVLFYGLLSKMKLFGDPYEEGKKGEAKLARAINFIFSLAAALFLMSYTAVGLSLATFFGSMFSGTSIILVTVICIGLVMYLVAAIAGIDIIKGKANLLPKIGAIIGLLIALAVFLGTSGFGLLPSTILPSIGLPSSTTIAIPGLELSPQDIMILALLVVTAIAMWWVVSGEITRGKPKPAQ